MKITSIEPVVVRVDGASRRVLLKGGWVFLRVRTDEGIAGLGEASHSGDDKLLLAAAAAIEVRVRGRSPFDILALRAEMRRVDNGRIARTAASAVEQALWDIRGRSLGVPIRALLGGALRESLRLYANINRSLGDRSPEAFARHAAAAVADGFRAIKIAPFDELGDRSRVRSGSDAAWRIGVARASAVRAAIGPGVELAIDCHGRMEASEAIEAGKALAELDILWYEEPVADAYPADLARVSGAVSVTTASGESLYSVTGFRPLLVERVVDVLMPDVKHCGGLAECRAIADAAEMQDLLVAPHNPSGPVASAATAQVASVMSNFLILEHAWAEVPWRADLLDPPERIVDGQLALPDGPGLGHVLNEEVVAAHRAE